MRQFIFLTLVFLLSECPLWATTWTVSNQPNSPGQFTSIQAAIISAAAADTLLVSAGSYGAIVIDKPLTLLGEGNNSNSGPIVSVPTCIIRSSDVNIAGFEMALRIEGQNTPGLLVEDVIVERCRFIAWPSSAVLIGIEGPATGSTAIMRRVIFRNNLIEDGLIGLSNGGGINNVNIDTLVFSNNVFSFFSFRRFGDVSGTDKLFITHNLFINGAAGPAGSTIFLYQFAGGISIFDAIITDNIFYSANPQGCVNCMFFNNLTFGNGVNDTLSGPVNNNIFSADPLFVNYSGGAFSYSHDYHLLPGSPAIGTASDGTDIGIFGGLYPFEVGTGPAIPVVKTLNLINSAVEINGILQFEFNAHQQD